MSLCCPFRLWLPRILFQQFSGRTSICFRMITSFHQMSNLHHCEAITSYQACRMFALLRFSFSQNSTRMAITEDWQASVDMRFGVLLMVKHQIRGFIRYLLLTIGCLIQALSGLCKTLSSLRRYFALSFRFYTSLVWESYTALNFLLDLNSFGKTNPIVRKRLL